MNKFQIIPPSLRQLQRPWFSKHGNPRVEGMMRLGSRIEARYPDRAPIIKQWVSGGAGTVFEDPAAADPKLIRSFLELSKGQYHEITDKIESARARDELELFLASRGVELVGRGGSPAALMNHDVTREILRVLSILPVSHFGHDHFTRFRLGGWGGGAAKFSRYQDPEVHLFTFATRGPLRNLYALMLHEIGHSFIRTLPKQYLEVLDEARKKLHKTNGIFGVDYLHGSHERRGHCLSSLKEFVPELYLMYVTQGAFTKEGLDLYSKNSKDDDPPSYINRYLENLTPKDSRLLSAIWNLYKKCFEGIEYI